MPTPSSPFLKLVLGGAAYGPEAWSIGQYWGLVVTATPTPAQMNTLAASLLSAFNSGCWNVASNSLKAVNPAGITLRQATLYYYNGGGLVAAGAATQTAVPGTNTNAAPSYVSRVITNQSDQPGRSHRGRVYLPWCGQPVDVNTGLWPSAASFMANYRSTQTAMVSAIQSSTWATSASAAVVSQRLGVLSFITSWRMDNKPDSQRGRGKKIIPSVSDVVT